MRMEQVRQSEDKGAKAYLAEQFPEKPFNLKGMLNLHKSLLQTKMLPQKLNNILTIDIPFIFQGCWFDEYSVSPLFLKAFDLWLTSAERMVVGACGVAILNINLQKDHESRLKIFYRHLQNTHKFVGKKKQSSVCEQANVNKIWIYL